MDTDITETVRKILYDLLLKRCELIKFSLKPEFRSLCSPYNEPTKLFFGNDLTKHVKDLKMTTKLKRNESYYQSKYSTINIQKIMSNVTQRSLFKVAGGRASQKSQGRPEQVTANINFSIKCKFKTYFSKFSWGTNY